MVSLIVIHYLMSKPSVLDDNQARGNIEWESKTSLGHTTCRRQEAAGVATSVRHLPCSKLVVRSDVGWKLPRVHGYGVDKYGVPDYLRFRCT